jgi:hypothetical protein
MGLEHDTAGLKDLSESFHNGLPMFKPDIGP